MAEDTASGEVIGTVALEKLGEPGKVTGELRRMSLAPKARGTGLAMLLVRAVEEFAADNGCVLMMSTYTCACVCARVCVSLSLSRA